MPVFHKTTATGGDEAGKIGATQYNEEHVGIAGDGGFSFKYSFSTTVGGTPSTGTIRMDNASPESATSLIIYETDATGVVMDAVLDLVNPTDFVMLSNSDRTKYHVYLVPYRFVSGAGVDTLPVRWIAGTGNTGSTTQFTNAEVIFLTIQHADYDDVTGIAMQVSRCNYLL